MDNLMNTGIPGMEINTEGPDIKTIRRKWKHRRSRSTSNLLNSSQATHDTDTDDDEGDRIDSDAAERSLAKLSLQPKALYPRATIVESDSFNEFFGSSSHDKGLRRRRRHKRTSLALMAPPPPPDFLNDESGKRKRHTKLQPPNPHANYVDVELMAIADEFMDEEMKSDDESSISSEDEDCPHPSCDEGREADDEHSDWVGDEWMEEIDSKRLHTREIRAGKRRVQSNKPPVFSIRTSYNDMLAKFLQNSEQIQLKLDVLGEDELTQLSHLASLYSLQVTTLKDCHIVTKTPATTQMIRISPIVSDSDTSKRVRNH